MSLLLWSVSIDLPASSLVVSAPPVPAFPFRRAPSARRFRTRPCRFPVSSRAIRPTFPPRPCQFSRFVARHPPDVSTPARAVFPFRRAPSARRFRPARAVFPFRRAPSARRFRPARAVFPFRRATSARRFRPARAVFPFRRAPFARRSRLSVRFPVASCIIRSASLPVRPVPRPVPFRASCAPFFLSFAGYYCTRRTSLLFGGLLGKSSH